MWTWGHRVPGKLLTTVESDKAETYFHLLFVTQFCFVRGRRLRGTTCRVRTHPRRPQCRWRLLFLFLYIDLQTLKLLSKNQQLLIICGPSPVTVGVLTPDYRLSDSCRFGIELKGSVWRKRGLFPLWPFLCYQSNRSGRSSDGPCLSRSRYWGERNLSFRTSPVSSPWWGGGGGSCVRAVVGRALPL